MVDLLKLGEINSRSTMLYDMNEIREMIRDLVCEFYKQKHIFITRQKHVSMIVERIINKIDPNNIPDIEMLKQLIEKETG